MKENAIKPVNQVENAVTERPSQPGRLFADEVPAVRPGPYEEAEKVRKASKIGRKQANRPKRGSVR